VEPTEFEGPDDREALIGHLGWIRALARHLAADRDRAEDLAQDTLVIALSHQPHDLHALQGWLRTIMRRLVHRGRRGESRRREREESTARSEGVDATDELVARASVQREIVQAVLELEEPYRSTILLRFFEDVPPRDIAVRQGVPVVTVHSRLRRALALLRERLDATHGRSDAWLPCALPLAWKSKGTVAGTLGGLIMKTKVTIAVISIALLATVAAIFGGTRETSSVVNVSSSSGPAHAADEVRKELATGAERAERIDLSTSATTGTAALAPAPAEAAAAHHVRGRVLSAIGLGQPGVEVAFEDGGAKTAARSGAGGVFELDTTLSQGTVELADARFASVCAALWRASSSIEPLVIVAPAIEVGGTVVDPTNAPVRGARVSLAMPTGFDTTLGRTLESTRASVYSGLTDDEGRFTLRAIPQVAGATVRVLVDGYEPAFQPEPAYSDLDLRFQLTRPTVLAKGALRGRVLQSDGQVASNARVAVGCVSTLADERGEFAVDLSRAVTADVVTAVKQGQLPARMERPNAPHGDDSGWPAFIELRLGGPSLSIVGRVVDPKDQPRAGVGIWIADPTLFGLVGRMPVQTESLAAGAAIPASALDPIENPPQQDGNLRSIYVAVGQQPDAVWHYVVTDKEGRFRLDGLDDRDYTVRVYDPGSMQLHTSKPIRAGTMDARVELPAPEVFEKLSGRILTVGGRPVPRASVVLRAKCFHVQARSFGGTQEVDMLMRGADVTTDEDGRFSFDRVPREHVFLEIGGDAIVRTDWPIPAGIDPTKVEIFVEARCRLEVRLAPPTDRADQVMILDAEDRALQIVNTNSERTRGASFVTLENGRSGVLSVSSNARKLELKKNGTVVETRELSLVPDEIFVLEM
jgi:RNA polymerase sigma-70 factor (ECF subfamily)